MEKTKNQKTTVRKPAVSGMFYDSNPKRLKRNISELFENIKVKNDSVIIISPHAGYIYSGRTAAHAISTMSNVEKFIILGPNHTGVGPSFSVMSNGKWQTPLGDCGIDSELASEIKKCNILEEDQVSHEGEHSIEVQLPLLQHKIRNFTFVPICIMNMGYSKKFLAQCVDLGKAIAKIIKNSNGKVGIIASSDFSHYLPLHIAEKKDEPALEKIKHLDLEGFFSTLSEVDASICGFGPIAVAMSCAKELKLKPKLIMKTSSGDTSGDYNSVVTYLAVGFHS